MSIGLRYLLDTDTCIYLLKRVPKVRQRFADAGVAVSCQLTLVTNNLRHYDRIPGISLENWLAD